MSTMPSITLTNDFGHKVELTKKEFIARWTQHVGEARSLAQTDNDTLIINAHISMIENLAAARFKSLLEAQANPEAS